MVFGPSPVRACVVDFPGAACTAFGFRRIMVGGRTASARRGLLMTLIEKTSIAVAWLAISIGGATFVFWHWSARGQSETAAAFAGYFVAIMTGVFAVGTLSYA